MKNMKNIAIAAVIIAIGAVAYFIMQHKSEDQNVKIQQEVEIMEPINK